MQLTPSQLHSALTLLVTNREPVLKMTERYLRDKVVPTVMGPTISQVFAMTKKAAQNQ